MFRAPEFDAETDMSVSVVESGFWGQALDQALVVQGVVSFLQVVDTRRR